MPAAAKPGATAMSFKSVGNVREEMDVAARLSKPFTHNQLRRCIDAVLEPRVGETKEETSSSPEDEWSRPSAEHSLRILLAEDNTVNQKLITQYLEKQGHKIEVAEDGKEAVATYRSRTFDLVLLDIQMPEMNGFEATREIRALEESGGGQVPIIALTAHATEKDREKCMQAGMDDYLSKPVEMGTLAQVVVEWTTPSEELST